MNGGIVIVNTSLMAVGSNVVTAEHTWNGGFGVLVLGAAQLAPIVNLMLVGVGKENQAIKVNSGALIASGVYGLQLPAGRYAIHSATGSSIGLYAALMPTP